MTTLAPSTTGGPTPFEPPKSLVEEIVRALTDQIVRGELRPGTRLVEERLASELGISRPPIREAFRVLHRERLVDIAPRRGVRVHEPTAREIADVYVCREALEGLSARLAAERIDAPALASLEALERKMADAARTGDLNRYFEANVRFHDEVAVASQNESLVALLRTLGTRVLQMRHYSLSLPGRAKLSARIHRQLITALRRGDGPAAESLTKKLISDAARALSVTDGRAT